MQWAVMGTGSIARKVTPRINAGEGCRVALIASRSLDRARAFAAELAPELGHTPEACTYDDLLARSNTGSGGARSDPRDRLAVYLTLPNHEHPRWSRRLLEAGAHVLCEKPLAWTEREASALFETARTHRRVLVEAFMYHHHPLTACAVELTRAAMRGEGPLGELQRIVARFDINIADGPTDNVRYSRALAGGALMDLGCYPLGFARLLTGEEPDQLSARASKVALYRAHAGDTDDAVDGSTEINGAFASGIDFELSCSMIGDRSHNVSARVIGTRGTLECPDFPKPSRFELRCGDGVEALDGPDGMTAYTLQAESFARAVRRVEQGAPDWEMSITPAPSWSIAQAKAVERVLREIDLSLPGMS